MHWEAGTLTRGKTETAEGDAEILRAVSANLTPEGAQSLDALAGLTVALDAPTPDPETYLQPPILHLSQIRRRPP